MVMAMVAVTMVVNEDGIVGVSDLLAIIAAWGATSP